MLTLKTMDSSRLRGSKLRNRYCDEKDKNEMSESAAGTASEEIEKDSISTFTLSYESRPPRKWR